MNERIKRAMIELNNVTIIENSDALKLIALVLTKCRTLNISISGIRQNVTGVGKEECKVNKQKSQTKKR